MSERKTRRQAAAAAVAAAAAAADADSTPTKSDAHDDMNGNSHTKTPITSDTDAGPDENIFLFWPNLIGYFRIVLAIASLYYMPLHPRTCSLLYSFSCLLDALDGYAARYFNQSTRFGAVLDMVTDRCTTSCLLVFLSSAFPRWAIVFQGLISLDFASHYLHMYATLAMGGSAESHKNVDKSRSWLLNLYYTNKTVLFVTCALNELFFIALYLLSFSSPLLSPQLLQTVGETKAAAEIQGGAQVNSSLIRQLFTNPYSAAALEMARANKMDSTWPWILAGISAPVMIIKNILNVVQLVKASRWLAEGDVRMRRTAGLPKAKKGRKAN
jgi:CDP-diacylglycerol--inositol 3-phosphatidyltransferase